MVLRTTRCLEDSSWVSLLNQLVFEFQRSFVAKARVWSNLVVVPPPVFDGYLGINPVGEPFQA